ncbi:MAG: hypothetical protein C4523_05645 [Myxococcales bacterium]|nr:MAG: hypothetical protein C4523_05645 [Myxococcales bacterium]
MTNDLLLIAGTAATIGFIHTLAGPDHYLPFVMIGRARNWNRPTLAAVTALCGVGHVLSSVLLGFVGIAIGAALVRLELIESVRGELASYLLIAFGLAYGVWGLRAARRGHVHRHSHDHPHKHDHPHDHDHDHPHEHGHDHAHDHERPHDHYHVPEADAATKKSVVFWSLFIVFVLGPCEPLIPLIMFPAAAHSLSGVVFVSLVFGVVTIVTMTALTLALHAGVKLISTAWMERYVHALAGFIIASSGLAVAFLGL